MADKLITGAVACRKRKGQTEWLLVQSAQNSGWEIPKDAVRRGESSVGAAIRFMTEENGLRARVLEEAGRATSQAKDGTEEKLIFYLMYLAGGTDTAAWKEKKKTEIKWFPYVSAGKKLSLAREKRILKQANNVFREWQKEKAD